MGVGTTAAEALLAASSVGSPAGQTECFAEKDAEDAETLLPWFQALPRRLSPKQENCGEASPCRHRVSASSARYFRAPIARAGLTTASAAVVSDGLTSGDEPEVP